MDWYDTLVKIAVGACLGFGIIALARLTRKKDAQGGGSEGRPVTERDTTPGGHGRGDAP